MMTFFDVLNECDSIVLLKNSMKYDIRHDFKIMFVVDVMNNSIKYSNQHYTLNQNTFMEGSELIQSMDTFKKLIVKLHLKEYFFEDDKLVMYKI